MVTRRHKKIKRIAKNVTERQSDRHGRNIDTGAAEMRARTILKERKSGVAKSVKRTQARQAAKGTPIGKTEARTKARATVARRSTKSSTPPPSKPSKRKTGSTKRTRAVTKAAKAVAGRQASLPPNARLSAADARAKARAIVKKRKK